MCRICRAPEKADVVAAIDAGDSDRAIEAKSRFARMSVWRFRRCLAEQRERQEKLSRDARLRNSKLADRRIVVEWRGQKFTWDGKPFDFLRDFDIKNDQLMVVEFDPLPAVLPNPPKAKPEPEGSPQSPEVVPEIAD